MTPKKLSTSWHVYIVRCQDGSLYTGITTDVKRRVVDHNTSPTAARYTKSRRPVKLVYSKRVGSKSAASVEEARIKKLPRAEKLMLIKKLGPRPRNAIVTQVPTRHLISDA